MSELSPLVLNPPPNVVKISHLDQLLSLEEFLKPLLEVGFDIETTPTKDFYWRRIRSIQFGNSEKQFVIDLLELCGNDSELLYNSQGEFGKYIKGSALQGLVEFLEPFLCSDSLIKIGVNVGFEYECFYWLLGLRIFGLYDCMIAEKCIYAGLSGQASLKNYEFYSMESLMERYFSVSINKELQTSFNLDDPLSIPQLEYAALDTRTPLAIKGMQSLIISGETPSSLRKKGKTILASRLENLNKQLFGDNLQEIVQIENAAIGAFIDMHVHGERLDCDSWLTRAKTNKEKLAQILKNLDETFLPIVGSKLDIVTEYMVEQAKAKWKVYNEETEEETKLKAEIRVSKKTGKLELYGQLTLKQNELIAIRKEIKEKFKKEASELGKRRTRLVNLADKCEGEALINYESDAQLKEILRENFKALKDIEGLDDETLEKYNHIPIMKLIQDYHAISKEVGTYGEAWATKWATHPCGEEGWLHPVTGRLHSNFNQYDAATGRSSSTQPNAQNLPKDKEVRKCFINDLPDEKGEEYTKITIDMSGAELRILAEEAQDPIWIKAFNNDEDVHSSCTELMYPEEWKKLALPDCAYFTLKPDGTLSKKKCKCPAHLELRDATKSANFGLAYGIGPRKLSLQIGKTYVQTKDLMYRHKQNFPYIWQYLEKSGFDSKASMRSFDMFGRRRLFEEPTWELAKEYCKDDIEKRLKVEPEVAKKNIETFVTIKGRKPTAEEKWELIHRQPTDQEISKSFQAMYGNASRQGTNHRIQGTNATIAKLAIGSGKDKNNKPFLWHLLPHYGAKLQKFVHDEIVISVPVKFSKEVAELCKDAFKRAANEKFKNILMESEYNIANYWCK